MKKLGEKGGHLKNQWYCCNQVFLLIFQTKKLNSCIRFYNYIYFLQSSYKMRSFSYSELF